MTRRCFLRCLVNSHKPIELPHNKEIIIGRSKNTKIVDQACSRKQLMFKADCENSLVEIKQIGTNPSGLDGFSLKSNSVYKVGHGSRIEILLNKHINIIEFSPIPEDNRPQVGIKRKLEHNESPSHKKKIVRTSVEKELSDMIKENTEDVWEEFDNRELYVFTAKGVKSSCKIAAYDMDGTLIKTKSGKVYPVDTSDWQIAFPSVSQKLKQNIADGFKVVILSNQAPIGKGRVKIEDFKIKLENIIHKLDVPIQAFLATGKSIYRKPTTGMWNILKEQKNDDVNIDMVESFYVGDAAGRVANWAPGKKKDHSMADKLLAENLGLKFYTPEQYFLGHSGTNVPISKPEFNPKELKPEPFNDKLISQQKEILIFVGYPGSGKSYLASQLEKISNHQYIAVCRDKLGSWQKCASEASKLLQKGKSVIVDSTNPDMESRARWTSLAKQMNVECRCARLLASKAHAQHNNKFRELMKINHLPVNDIVFHSYKNKFVEPKLSEGFKEIIDVKFNPDFKDEEAEKLYNMYLLEK